MGIVSNTMGRKNSIVIIITNWSSWVELAEKDTQERSNPLTVSG